MELAAGRERELPLPRLQHPKPRRKLSAKARKAIADAQRKRWAKVKSQKKAAAGTSTS